MAGVFTNTVFAFLKAYVLLAVIGDRTVGGLDAASAVTFTFVVEGVTVVASPFGELGLAERIRTGDVVVDLYRPVDVQRYWLAHEGGRAVFQAFVRGAPPFVIGAVVFEMTLPPHLGAWVTFLVSVALAVMVAFALRFLVELVGFWILDARGAPAPVVGDDVLLGVPHPGVVVPDGAGGSCVGCCPSSRWRSSRASCSSASTAGVGAGLGVLAFQLAWAVVLLAVGRLVLARATRMVVVHGG